MKSIIQKLRQWCGTEETEEKEEILNNKGRVTVWLSLGSVIAVVFFCFMFFIKCSDCVTCGGCTKCINCVTCGACDLRE